MLESQGFGLESLVVFEVGFLEVGWLWKGFLGLLVCDHGPC